MPLAKPDNQRITGAIENVLIIKTTDVINQILKIFNESPYGCLAPDSHEADEIKRIIIKAIGRVAAKRPKKYGKYNEGFHDALDQVEELLTAEQ